MADFLNFLMLICASVGATVFGILAAYGILRIAFSLMRRHAHPGMIKPASVKAPVQPAQVL
jgi:hypothetical protein